MRQLRTPFHLAPVLALAAVLAGCGNPEERAARFAGEYEAAMANNDPWHARIAMQRAVSYDDANPQYWAALAQTQMMLADYSGAYASYQRATELDRSDVAVLQALADLSVMSGHLVESRDYARQVLLLRPSDPAPQATLGFVALRERDYETALEKADAVLAVMKEDSNATILKARALTSLDRADEAVKLLNDHTAAHPRDQAALNSLAMITERIGDVKGQEQARARLLALNPDNPGRKLDHISSLYAVGQRERAWRDAVALVRAGAGDVLMPILEMWIRFEPRARSLAEVRARLPGATAADRLRFAYYLILVGEPAEAEGILRGYAALPVTPANVGPVALLGRALEMQGKRDEALKLLDAAIAFDRSNVPALRARTDLYLHTGRGREAVFDAQKLVAEKPESGDDRVRLARAYAMTGQAQLAENTYRAGIQDIPANPALYADLRRYLIRRGRSDELAALDQRYVEQKQLARAQW